ncbi:MAG: hypothetical protein SXV54_16030 [Chloroflexota bacterium]|nr:hypothetical protein [Chloroflexota bacterium]
MHEDQVGGAVSALPEQQSRRIHLLEAGFGAGLVLRVGALAQAVQVCFGLALRLAQRGLGIGAVPEDLSQ